MKKQAKNWTRNVIYISIFQVLHRTDVEVKVSKRSFLLYAGDLICFFQLVQYFARYSFVVLLTIADLAMIMPSATWNLLDFRVAEKEKLLKQYLFAQPWWSRLWSALLAVRRISKVISRKLTGQIVLHGPNVDFLLSSFFMYIFVWFHIWDMSSIPTSWSVWSSSFREDRSLICMICMICMI